MNKKRQKGFTVVELVVTIVIAGIIIPSVAIALNNLAAINHRARDYALANTIAQNKVETLRSDGYNSINNGVVNFSNELPAAMGSPKSASYTVSTPVVGGNPVTGEKQIDISISFTEYNATRSLSFRTYISELGVGQ
jgi:prepilin-type N-terminal cleavage/methylation domain-containing protein